jgi:uncharacterized membrane-anchored protein
VKLAALVLWIMTAVGGAYMAAVLLRTGNRASSAVASHLPSGLVFGHGFLALAGLAAWAVYMDTNTDAFGWGLVILLVLVAGGGSVMFLRWHRDRKQHAGERLAEQQIPSGIVHLHGGLAALTIVAVVVAVLSN